MSAGVERTGNDAVIACSGIAAVNQAERILCGYGAVTSAGAAQGAVAAGGRAAVLVEEEGREHSGVSAGHGSGSWILHRRRQLDGDAHGGFAFELLAGDAQQAVDHCLVAHRLAVRLGRPGVCSLDPQVADELALVRLPDAEASSFDNGTPGPSKATTADAVLDVAREAFRSVATSTGRPCLPVERWGPESARFAIVAAGAARALARAAARLLQEEGVECSVVTPALLSPAPVDELQQAIGAAVAVAVIDPHGAARGQIEMATLIRSALWDRGERPVHGIVHLPRAARELADALRLTFGLEPPAAPVQAKPEAQGQALAIGAVPAGDWAESLLLEVAGKLAGMSDEPHLALLDLPGVSAIAVGDEQHPANPDHLDVLVAADHSLLESERIAHLRHGAAVVILSTSPGTAPALTASTRELLKEAGARIYWQEVENAGPIEDDMRLAYHAGAVVAGCGRASGGRETDTLAALRRVGAFGDMADSWTAGAAALTELSEAVPVLDVVSTPSMPEEPDEIDPDPDWVEAVRRFHVTGSGGVSPSEPAGGLPLRPCALESLLASEEESDRYPVTVEDGQLPGEAGPIELRPQTLIELLTRAVICTRRDRRNALHEEISHLVQGLEGRLKVDAGLDQAPDPTQLSAALGDAPQLDFANLAQRLPVSRGSQRLGDERRQRIETTLEQLQRFLDIEQDLPEVVLLHPQAIEIESLPEGVTAVLHDNGMEAAAGYFEASSRQMVDVFRAARVARLEMDDGYHPDYDAMLARLDWQALSAEELAMVPPVFVVETADRVLGRALSGLSTLLRSGRPLRLIIVDPSPAMFHGDAARLAAPRADLGYLAVSHRDALVLQTTLALPRHLFDGLKAVAASLRPSVAVVAVPEWSGPVSPQVQLIAAHQGRATPCFLYDPDAGPTRAERFDLTPNPKADESWPRLTVEAESSGEHIEWEEPFTFAHAAVLATRCRHGFRVIPPEAWGGEQMPIAEYMDLEPPERMRRIPYLWVVADDGRLARAVMTRAMAHACADRLQHWRALQELGGRRNDYARRAVAELQDRTDSEAQQQQDELEQAHAEDLERVRAEEEGRVIERLAHVLVADEGWQGTNGGVPSVASAPASDTEEAVPDVETEELKPEEIVEGFIDSSLCTTCHDCININGRMFQYDDNKQAFIADPAAGTYAELVKAAEACPARCIHPGAPRQGDQTASDKLVERARKFN